MELGADEGASHIQGRGIDVNTGDTIVYYHIFIFEQDLFQLGSDQVWRLLQHEVGHYLGIDHGDSFNNYEIEDCWEYDSEEEDDSDDSGGGGRQIVVIRTIENWICEYEVITVCAEDENDSGEDVCWQELKLLRCYQVS